MLQKKDHLENKNGLRENETHDSRNIKLSRKVES